jgi:hypothetical protein
MTTRAFKSISPQELEAAIASAISAITNTPTEVSIGQWKEVTGLNNTLARQRRFELELSVTATKSDDDPTLPENIIKSFAFSDDEQPTHDRIARGSLKDDLDPATRDDDDTRPF